MRSPERVAACAETPAATTRSRPAGRPEAQGKFLVLAGEKLYVRGVTYGPFRPNGSGDPYPEPGVVARDLAQMRRHGINAVRCYTAPPRWLLDAAWERGLRVLVGLPAEQPVAFLDDARLRRQIERRVREAARACAGHPALLGYAIGNEIPAPIVRWHGRRRVERFLEHLHDVVRAEDDQGLVTYVNYPSSEYLELPFLDFVSFNVYLEQRPKLVAYLARLQNLAGERPLLLAEIGFDSLRHGEAKQARVLEWQIRTAFEAGCAGAFVFGWTSEWFHGGFEIEDWDFGLTSRQRRPKRALASVQRAFSDAPVRAEPDWPRVSVVVCSYNGEATIRDTLEGLSRLAYPDYETIVVDDGSTDATAQIAESYGVRVLSTENRGLSAARNLGFQAARGEIVAYIDDDAYPDPHWLEYLVLAFREGGYCGVGGPNLLPPEDGAVAECVANAPGGPAHVLLSDREAEHIPGCNMAFRRSWLQDVGGFDPRFRCAGDDVDLCWRLQQRGGRLGFHAAALVWHHRRSSLLRYWRQQVGYGKAEALLERKWPERYNTAGHVPWSGRIYGPGITRALVSWGGRIYHGTWGTAPFQSLYQRQPGRLWSLPLLPEWIFVVLFLALLSVLSPLWPPLRIVLPLLGLAVAAPVVQALHSAAKARLRTRSRVRRGWQRALVALLHLLQPAARLTGRLRHGLSPLHVRSLDAWVPPAWRSRAIWSERWRSPEQWLGALEAELQPVAPLLRGGDFDRWDLQLRGGFFGSARVLMCLEEHGAGRQYARFRILPKARRACTATALAGALGGLALLDGAWAAGAVFGATALVTTVAGIIACGVAQGHVLRALARLGATAEAAAELQREPLAGAELEQT